jgi:hypothetical protein
LKLEYDEPLSNFAFNFNVRRYSTGVRYDSVLLNLYPDGASGGALQVASIKPRVESAPGFSA